MGKSKSPKNKPAEVSPPASPQASPKQEKKQEPVKQQPPPQAQPQSKADKKAAAQQQQQQAAKGGQQQQQRPGSPKGKAQQPPEQVLKNKNPNKGQPNKARRGLDPDDTFNAYHEEMDLIWNQQGAALIAAGQRVIQEAPEGAPQHSDPYYPFLRPANPNYQDDDRDDSEFYGRTSFLTAPKKRHQKLDKRRNQDEAQQEFEESFWGGKKIFQKQVEGMGDSGFNNARAVLRVGGHRGNGNAGFRGR